MDERELSSTSKRSQKARDVLKGSLEWCYDSAALDNAVDELSFVDPIIRPILSDLLAHGYATYNYSCQGSSPVEWYADKGVLVINGDLVRSVNDLDRIKRIVRRHTQSTFRIFKPGRVRATRYMMRPQDYLVLFKSYIKPRDKRLRDLDEHVM